MNIKTRLFLIRSQLIHSKGLSPKTKKITKNIIFLIIGIIIGLILSIPFIWMFWCAFQETTNDLYVIPPKVPNFFYYDNFKHFITDTPFLNQLKNTLIIVLSSMTLNIVASILVAYGFARFQAKGKKLLFGVLLSTMMLPWVVTMVPAYILFARFGMIGTEGFPYLPLVLPSIGGSAYNIFLLKQFIEGIPKELDEAARIDGCGSFRNLIQILLPNCLPIIATVVIFAFIGTWGDYVGPSIYILNTNDYTLGLGLQFLKSQTMGAIDWPLVMAGCVVYAIPIIIVFVTCQKAYVRGAVGSAIK